MGAIKKTKAAKYVLARVRVHFTTGQQVRNVRELQEMTQAELAESSGVSQPTISSIEADRVSIGVERAEKLDLETFFAEAPRMNPNARLVTGLVCGVRVEDVADPLMRKVRWLDKRVDELAKGKKMTSILRA